MNELKEIISIMGKKYKKQDSINSDIAYINRLYNSKVITKETFDIEITRLSKEKEEIDKEIAETEKVLKGKWNHNFITW